MPPYITIQRIKGIGRKKETNVKSILVRYVVLIYPFGILLAVSLLVFGLQENVGSMPTKGGITAQY